MPVPKIVRVLFDESTQQPKPIPKEYLTSDESVLYWCNIPYSQRILVRKHDTEWIPLVSDMLGPKGSTIRMYGKSNSTLPSISDADREVNHNPESVVVAVCVVDGELKIFKYNIDHYGIDKWVLQDTNICLPSSNTDQVELQTKPCPDILQGSTIRLTSSNLKNLCVSGDTRVMLFDSYTGEFVHTPIKYLVGTTGKVAGYDPGTRTYSLYDYHFVRQTYRRTELPTCLKVTVRFKYKPKSSEKSYTFNRTITMTHDHKVLVRRPISSNENELYHDYVEARDLKKEIY